MTNLIVNKMILAAGSALTILGLLAVTTNPVQADIAYTDKHNPNHIQIHRALNDNDKRYVVNGKVILWQDLTPEQQAKISAIEKKLHATERAFDKQEKELTLLAEQVSRKAQFVDSGLESVEQAREALNENNIDMNSLQRMADKLANLSKVNQDLMKQHEVAAQALQQKIDAMDMSFIDDVQVHAKALEEVLIEIASQM
ncbi:hypothetical protein [Thalassotalea marina]|uniref:Uncharacterized protein n=1 Tax=Thalassotalea marina TaxID=1673741 RepID=A0A919BLW5_9GAMM|nr:hypothetical protein [Thalassotalea marina]GHF97823.1 hypothetical protein GCM10017161_27620 [Thalassotalea marina]